MAINKKAAGCIAAFLTREFATVTAARTFWNRLVGAADTNNKSFRKTAKRITKALTLN